MEERKMTRFGADAFFPRLIGNSFWQPLAELRGTGLDELSETGIDLRRSVFHPNAEYRVSEDELTRWRTDLNSWAYDQGFPNQMSRRQRNQWDVELGIKLIGDTEDLPESLHPEVWCWIAVYLLPHFVVHRWGWPDLDKEGGIPRGRSKWARFGPDARNGLRLAMHRVDTFGADAARRAEQEEFQSIQNRPSYSLDRRVSRVILEALLDALDDESSPYGKNDDGKIGNRRIDANNVGIELRIINSMQPLCFASDDQIKAIMADIIDRLPELRKREAPPSEDDDND